MPLRKGAKRPAVHDADRPRVHKDIHPHAVDVRWSKPRPPKHDGKETLVQRPHTAEEAVYVETGDGRHVWVNPGEVAYVAQKAAKQAEAA